jgi:hypothetical protein
MIRMLTPTKQKRRPKGLSWSEKRVALNLLAASLGVAVLLVVLSRYAVSSGIGEVSEEYWNELFAHGLCATRPSGELVGIVTGHSGPTRANPYQQLHVLATDRKHTYPIDPHRVLVIPCSSLAPP